MKTIYVLTRKGAGPAGHGEPGQPFVELMHGGEWFDIGKFAPAFTDRGEALKYLAETGKSLYWNIMELELR